MKNEIIDTKVNDLIKFIDNRIADLECKYEEIDELWDKASELVLECESKGIPDQEEYDKACENTCYFAERSEEIQQELKHFYADLDNLKELYYHLDIYDIT